MIVKNWNFKYNIISLFRVIFPYRLSLSFGKDRWTETQPFLFYINIKSMIHISIDNYHMYL